MTAPEYGQDSTSKQAEPVALHTAIVTVLAAIVTILWGAMPEDTVLNSIATVIAALFALLSTVVARGKVTPTDSPRDDNGRSLIPAALE